MNKTIIGGVVFIAAASVLRRLTSAQPITPVLIGAYVFLGLLAMLDLFGGVAESLANAFVTIAVIVVALDVFPWNALGTLLGLHTPTPQGGSGN